MNSNANTKLNVRLGSKRTEVLLLHKLSNQRDTTCVISRFSEHILTFHHLKLCDNKINRFLGSVLTLS